MDLAADLGVDEGDVDVLLNQLSESKQELPDDLAGFLRRLLDPHGERTAPSRLYWPGADEQCRQLTLSPWREPLARFALSRLATS
jgi:hypothetical protein